MEISETGLVTALLYAGTTRMLWIPPTVDTDLYNQPFLYSLLSSLLFKMHEHRDFVPFSLFITSYCTPSI